MTKATGKKSSRTRKQDVKTLANNNGHAAHEITIDEDHDLSIQPLNYPRTDLGNAEWFASKFKGKIKYDHHRERWLIYKVPLWRPDRTDEIILKIKDALRERRAMAEMIPDAESRSKEINWSLRSENNHAITSLLRLAKADPKLKTEGTEWDAEPYKLGCKNGVLDLTTGKILPESSNHLITLSTNIDYLPDRESEEWLRFIASVWPSPEMQRFIHKAVGYSLTGDTMEEALFALFGMGANGKSSFTETLTKCFGDYAHVMPFSAIEYKDRSQISNDVAALVGKRFVIASETQENIRLNEGRIKQLTSATAVTARFLYKEPFTFQPTSKIWIESNHKPRIVDDTDGMWRRLMMNELTEQFLGEKRDKNLKKRLWRKENLEGVLAWAVKGALLWQKEGLEPPELVKSQVESYKKESNPLTDFFADECVLGDDYYIRVADLLLAYREWCQDTKEKYMLNRHQFKQRMESMGFTQKMKGEAREMNWLGITLKRRLNGARNNRDLEVSIH